MMLPLTSVKLVRKIRRRVARQHPERMEELGKLHVNIASGLIHAGIEKRVKIGWFSILPVDEASKK